MSNEKLFLVFLWHMHQPLYKDPLSGTSILPWARLHGCKDYLDMVTILNDFPRIKQNINIVPSLLSQIAEYVDGSTDDRFLTVTLKRVSELTYDDKVFILKNFFLAHPETMIKAFPRYHELHRKRGVNVSPSEIESAVRYFSNSDFMDLQVLFNLAWIDPRWRKTYPELLRLEEKASRFDEDDKKLVIDGQIDILRKIIPAYREMHLAGKIELSVSPFYHPILPLLCDTDTARMAMPGVRLPRHRFRHREDADRQIKLALEFFENTFGFTPSGMWPSEGSVSEDTMRLIKENGLTWVATDESILSASLSVPIRDSGRTLRRPEILYTDYVYDDVSIIFRDHHLSDQIGFVYSSWDPGTAAKDFHDTLIRIHASSQPGKSLLVPIVLDGENAWEYYRNDGYDFLMSLYRLLNDDERIECVTISDYLERHSSRNRLQKLHAGSWVYGNFSIWIGHEEDNTAWDYITRTRNDLVRMVSEKREYTGDPWMYLYAAEGSDWFWWYGDDHSTDSAREFDELFRHNLMAVYKSFSEEPPHFLHVPVLRKKHGPKPAVPIRGFIHPEIDGRVTSYFEWLEGTYVEVGKSGGSMHRSDFTISRIYYGFDKSTLFIRADGFEKLSRLNDISRIIITFLKPSMIRISAEAGSAPIYRKEGETWTKSEDMAKYALADIFEIAIPFRVLGVSEGDEVVFSLSLYSGVKEIETCPQEDYIHFRVPGADFDALMWY